MERQNLPSLDSIWLKRGRRAPMDEVDEVRLIPGLGLEDNANQGGKRQVTIISAESWRDVEAELGMSIDPRARRANLMVRGIDLRECGGRVLQIGEGRVLLHGFTRPCELMEETQPGLQEALRPEWRGGAYGEVVAGGLIRRGDAVRWLDGSDDGAQVR